VQKDAGCIDHRRVGGIGADAQQVEDLGFEHLGGLGDFLLRHVAGADTVSKAVDNGATGFHDRGMAVLIDRGPQSREVEKAMNRGDASIVGFHGGYSNPVGTRLLGRATRGGGRWS